MPYSAGHKENTRRRIVEAAAAQFRKEGLAEAGVASIMQSAGLTHGGFYSHFGSKDDLVRETLSEMQGAALSRWQKLVEGATPGGGIEAIARWYLSPEHRDHPESGCMTSCIAADLPRLAGNARADFTANFAALVDYLASLLPSGNSSPRERAMAIYSGMLGALQLARAASDPALSDALLAAGIAAALKLAEA